MDKHEQIKILNEREKTLLSKMIELSPEERKELLDIRAEKFKLQEKDAD